VPVSCGIDAARYRAPRRVPAEVPTVLFVGRLDQEKRVDELIRAFAALPAAVPGRLEVIGDGARRAEWTALAADLGFGGRVTFRGFVRDEELLAAYAGADVFCMPGVAELQSLVTLESMAAGLPGVAADAMALPHLVRHGHNGWLYRPGDVGELTSRLASLLVDPALRRRMGAAGRDIVAEHEFDATLDAFEGIYTRVLGRAEPAVGRAA
jgi:glycosyltransferase involved in cell wall biosynthesis